jgi:hypothetical protein
MARQSSTRSVGSRLGRTETVSIRLDPRLNYLCEIAARHQRRTKSSFIEATIDRSIKGIVINDWSDETNPQTIGDLSEYLWHVRESQRLVSLGFISPHLLTFEEQQIWSALRENGYFWKGNWRGTEWSWNCNEQSVIRDRVDEYWEVLMDIARGEKTFKDLPKLEKKDAVPNSAGFGPGSDDEVPF